MAPNARETAKRRLHRVLTSLGAFVLMVVGAHVGWNLFAPDLLGLPRMEVKGAIGLALLLAVFAWALRAPRRA